MLRQWWVVGNQGIVEIVGLFVGGDETLELFEPIEDNVDLRGSGAFVGPVCRPTQSRARLSS